MDEVCRHFLNVAIPHCSSTILQFRSLFGSKRGMRMGANRLLPSNFKILLPVQQKMYVSGSEACIKRFAQTQVKGELKTLP